MTFILLLYLFPWDFLCWLWNFYRVHLIGCYKSLHVYMLKSRWSNVENYDVFSWKRNEDLQMVLKDTKNLWSDLKLREMIEFT